MSSTDDIRLEAVHRPPATSRHTLRVLVASPGLAGDARIIARALSSLDLELIAHTALDQTAEQIIDTVLHENADVLAMRIADAADLARLPRIAGLLQDAGIDDLSMTLGAPSRPGERIEASGSPPPALTRRESARDLIDAIESRLGLVHAEAIRVLRRSLTADGATKVSDGIWAFFALSPARRGRA